MNEPLTVALESYGVVIAIELDDPAVAGAVGPILPPGHEPADPSTAQVSFALRDDDGRGMFSVTQDSERVVTGVVLADAVGVLDALIRQAIAAGSTERIFVHAGVVAHRGRGLVLPGGSFSGKTELVVALLRAGATYYSDEFAVLDDEGLIHPYPRRLSVRQRGTNTSEDIAPETFGAHVGHAPVPPRLIAVTGYEPGASWNPTELTPAACAMRLLAHAGQARADPERALHAVDRAARLAVTLEGPRGEADETAEALLARLQEMP